VDFALPYLYDSLVMVQSRFTTEQAKPLPLRNIADLVKFTSKANRKVCIMGESATKRYVQSTYPDLQLADVSDLWQALVQIRAGGCVAAIESRVSTEIVLADEANHDMAIVGASFWSVPVGVGVRRLPSGGDGNGSKLPFPSGSNSSLAIVDSLSEQFAALHSSDVMEELEMAYAKKAPTPAAAAGTGTDCAAGEDSLKGNHLTFMVVEDPPFVVRNSDDEGAFSGFIIDSIEEIAKLLGFEYTLKVVESYKSGVDQVTDDSSPADCYWSGYFITEDRLKKNDFTTPFTDTGKVVFASLIASMSASVNARVTKH
jgi:hypothetical protein